MEPIRIEIHKSLPGKFRKDVNKLLDENFRSMETPEDRDKYFSVPCAYLLAVEKNSTIGMAKLFRREITYMQEKALLGGLGDICAREDRRRMGVATALIKRGMEELELMGCDVAYICTLGNVSDDLIRKLYVRVGFVPIGRPYTYLGKSGKRYTESNGMIAPLNSKEKSELILKGKEILNIGKGNW